MIPLNYNNKPMVLQRTTLVGHIIDDDITNQLKIPALLCAGDEKGDITVLVEKYDHNDKVIVKLTDYSVFAPIIVWKVFASGTTVDNSKITLWL